MLSSIISGSLRFRVLVIAIAAAIIVFGIQAVKHTPLDVFPEFAPPMVEIQTEAPGLSTEEVDTIVTVPLESALNSVPFVKAIRSKSVLGLSSVLLVFQEGSDLLKVRQLVQERLSTAASQLPDGVHEPVLMAPRSSLSRVLKIGLSSSTISLTDLSDLAYWTIRPRLMAVPGIANVAIWGQRDKQLQVIVDPERLRIAGISLETIRAATADAVRIDSGGFVDTRNQRLAVQQLSPIVTAEDLGHTIVEFRGGAPIRVEDVAEVVIDHPQLIGEAVINDGPGLLLIIEKQPWGNTLDVTRACEDVITTLKPGLEGVDIDTTIFRPATFIQLSISNLTRALWIGCALVAVTLILFLFDWRAALISILAIPLSLLAAIVVVYLSGQSINTMVLAGLVIAIGEVVDDAIIDVENIHRRLKLNALVENPLSRFKVILNASLEVRSAVVYASLIVVLVFVPVFFMQGLAGTFFRPLALSYITAIAASLIVALTVTPALCYLLFKANTKSTTDTRLVALLKGLYQRVLSVSLPRAKVLVLILPLLAIFTGFVWRGLGEEFLPDFKERDFLMHWLEKPGMGIDAMRRVTVEVSKELRQIPGVRNFGSHIGRAVVADEVVGPDFTELWISMDHDVPYGETLDKIVETVYGYPGLYRDVLTFLRERIKEVLTGSSASIVVRIFGPDLAQLRVLAEITARSMESVEGISSLKIEHQTLVPQIQIRLDPEKAQLHNLKPGHVRETINTFIKGTVVGQVYQNQKSRDVVVWGAEKSRQDIQSLKELLIDNPQGTFVPLGDIASIFINPTPNAIKREGNSRRIDVTCNVSGRDLGSVAREIEASVRQIAFPQEYHPEFLGEYESRQKAASRLLGLSAVVVIGILVLLQTDFQSIRKTAIVAISLPFALVGGVLAVWLTSGVLSLGSMVGFVTVLGIAARNGIMLVGHFKHLQLEEGMDFGRELVIRGAKERLVPILMTASTAALALVPLVVQGSIPGHEIEYPMAIVILGGLATSTPLNLFMVPPLYFWLGQEKAVSG